jgi:hypothetical protein
MLHDTLLLTGSAQGLGICRCIVSDLDHVPASMPVRRAIVVSGCH